MAYLFKLIAAPLMAIALLIAPAYADEIDRTDPSATAIGFLKAFKAKDVVAMAEFSNAENKEMFDDLAANGEASKVYNNVFRGWRFESASAWDGSVGQVRYRKGDAIVPFHEMEDDEIAVVVLTKENGVWGLEDINSPSKSRLESLPTSP